MINREKREKDYQKMLIETANGWSKYRKDFNFMNYLIEENMPDQFITIFHEYIFENNINKIDKNENTLLFYAVKNNNKKIAEFLLEHDADPNIANNNKNTPLHIAFSSRNYEMVNLLIRYKANEGIKNLNGLAPYECLDVDCE